MLKIFPKSSDVLSKGLLVFKAPYLVKTELIFHDATKIYFLFEPIKGKYTSCIRTRSNYYILGVKFIQFIQETSKDKKLKEDVMTFYARELFIIFECLDDCGFTCRYVLFLMERDLALNNIIEYFLFWIGVLFDTRSNFNAIFRDFKSHNILLRDDGHLVSTIFWESNPDKSFSNAAISLLSPEIIKRLRSKQRADSAEIKKQTDYEDRVSMWWSFGVFLYICLVGKVRQQTSHHFAGNINGSLLQHPFKNDKNELQEELMQKRKLSLPSDLSKPCKSLIREVTSYSYRQHMNATNGVLVART